MAKHAKTKIKGTDQTGQYEEVFFTNGMKDYFYSFALHRMNNLAEIHNFDLTNKEHFDKCFVLYCLDGLRNN